MGKNTKTVGGEPNDLNSFDPIKAVKSESIDRMRAALLSASLDDPLSSVTALRQVTMLRVYHQVSRIVQYLDLMDKLEEQLYQSIEQELNSVDMSENSFALITRLLVIQEKLQKSIVESNKLLAPYLEMEQYPAFVAVDASVPVSNEILEIPSSTRNELRENAGAILNELKLLQSSEKPVVEE